MRKFLYSPGFGAGWSTWANKEIEEFVLFYEPIIEFIENGGKFLSDDCDTHPLLKQLQDDLIKEFGEDKGGYFYTGGARDLTVGTVEDDMKFRIEEYDGSEYVEYRDLIDWH